MKNYNPYRLLSEIKNQPYISYKIYKLYASEVKINLEVIYIYIYITPITSNCWGAHRGLTGRRFWSWDPMAPFFVSRERESYG